MTRTYQEFWNNKLEEVCSTNVLKSFKPGEIQGVINVAWTIKKTDLLKEEMEEVNKQIVSKCQFDEKVSAVENNSNEKHATCRNSRIVVTRYIERTNKSQTR